MTDGDTRPALHRAPPSIAWVLLLASAAAALVTGLIGTALVLSQIAPWSTPLVHPALWIWLIVACGLTVVSLGLRTLRWIFLLRRSETRIPLRDACIGYLAGFSLLLAPFLLGEIAVRAYVLRARGRVPLALTGILNLWERWLDALALAAIVAAVALVSEPLSVKAVALGAVAVSSALPPIRRLGLRLARAVATPVAYLSGDAPRLSLGRLSSQRAWAIAFVTSLAAWILPGIALWGLANHWGPRVGFWQAALAYGSATLAGGLVLAPGGIIVAGGRLLVTLGMAGLPVQAAVLTVMGIRLATAGMSTVLGALFLLLHFRWRETTLDHFDAIADAYDVQIPLARRQALLEKKTELMREILTAHRIGRRGLDVGCGQGWYVARMREIGFDVEGIDASEGQVQIAERHVGIAGPVRVGSALDIPAADGTYDFVYSINVLHHLPSVADQRAAFSELNRVLKPGGLLFLHEINTRNVLFRFYMGYVFPSLNCIDEGVERWLLPNRLDRYANMPVIDVRYFTFLPDFIPQSLARLLAPLERILESSPAAVYSAHYMATLRKPS